MVGQSNGRDCDLEVSNVGDEEDLDEDDDPFIEHGDCVNAVQPAVDRLHGTLDFISDSCDSQPLFLPYSLTYCSASYRTNSQFAIEDDHHERRAKFA